MHRTLSNKYYVDEAYELFIGRPLVWISDWVFLRLGDRVLLDGSLNGMARLAQRAAGALGRVQTGSLHRYVFFVLLGSLAALAWSFRHG
jgi:NADH-quinone oxidoreductase subunit L